jgi:hypothetical protein
MPFQSRCIRKLAGLPDHLVCLEEERRGDGNAEGLGCLEVDHQLQPRGELDWHIPWRCAMQDFVHVCGGGTSVDQHRS